MTGKEERDGEQEINMSKKERETGRESETCGNDKTALNNLLDSVSVPKV